MCNKLNTALCTIMRLQKASKLQYNTKIGEHMAFQPRLMLPCSMLEKLLCDDDDEVIYIAKNNGLSLRVNITSQYTYCVKSVK